MQIYIPVSIGELIDKITILEIKSKKIKSLKEKSSLKKELKLLEKILKKIVKKHKENKNQIKAEKNNLKKINKLLWSLEDSIRIKEKNKSFDNEFISISRNIYTANDERFKIKSRINKLYKSNLKEYKYYSV
jgi:chromosome segregation ATPase